MIKLLLLGLILYIGYRIYRFSWRFHNTVEAMRGAANGRGSRGTNRRDDSRRDKKVYARDEGEYVDFEEISVVETETPSAGKKETRDSYYDGSRVSDAEYEDLGH